MDDWHVARCNVHSSGLGTYHQRTDSILIDRLADHPNPQDSRHVSFHDSAKRHYTPVHLHTRPLGVRTCPILPDYQAISNTRAPLPVNVKRDLMQVRSACRLRCPNKVCLMGNDVEARIRAGGRWTRWFVVLAVICVQRLSMFAFAVGHASGLR
jgi:hypothetical protein